MVHDALPAVWPQMALPEGSGLWPAGTDLREQLCVFWGQEGPG